MLKTCLIELEIGDRIEFIEDGRQGEIKAIKLSPNGVLSPELVAILFIELDNGNKLSATSDKFKPIDDEDYKEFHPSVFMNHL